MIKGLRPLAGIGLGAVGSDTYIGLMADVLLRSLRRTAFGAMLGTAWAARGAGGLVGHKRRATPVCDRRCSRPRVGHAACGHNVRAITITQRMADFQRKPAEGAWSRKRYSAAVSSTTWRLSPLAVGRRTIGAAGEAQIQVGGLEPALQDRGAVLGVPADHTLALGDVDMSVVQRSGFVLYTTHAVVYTVGTVDCDLRSVDRAERRVACRNGYQTAPPISIFSTTPSR